MSRAIVLAPTEKDVTSARKYGEVVYICGNMPHPFQIAELTTATIEGLERIEFDPDDDWIVLTGPPDRLATFVGIITANWEGPFNVLVFDAKVGAYKPRLFSPVQEVLTED